MQAQSSSSLWYSLTSPPPFANGGGGGGGDWGPVMCQSGWGWMLHFQEEAEMCIINIHIG